MLAVVVAKGKFYLATLAEDVARVDWGPLAGGEFLIGDGTVLDERSGVRGDDQVALLVNLEGAAIEGEGDAVGVGSGCEDEVVLELPVVAVIDEIDAGIDGAGAEALVGGEGCDPAGLIVTDVVVGGAGELVHGGERFGGGAEPASFEARSLEGIRDVRAVEQGGEALGVGAEGSLFRPLATVGLEGEGSLGEEGSAGGWCRERGLERGEGERDKKRDATVHIGSRLTCTHKCIWFAI